MKASGLTFAKHDGELSVPNEDNEPPDDIVNRETKPRRESRLSVPEFGGFSNQGDCVAKKWKHKRRARSLAFLYQISSDLSRHRLLQLRPICIVPDSAVGSSLHVCSMALSIPPEQNPNYRCNTSLLIDYCRSDEKHSYILIDVGKTFREQVLRWFTFHKIPRVDSIILTHEHADAVLGLDDIRAVQRFSPKNDIDATPVFLSQTAMDSNFKIRGWAVGSSYLGLLAQVIYIIDLLLASFLQNGSHNVHFCLPQALEAVKRLCPKQALLIGMNHEFDHYKDNDFLAEWSEREGIPVQLAHDGLRVPMDL
ncbi:hypothetical protein GH714_026963 [Hevea brasiliensis]|uniref:Metallo-beta-lactamase domain-containing protein n=1 Tax=Hevea brasiliensis TaxID=3981 RepID=A0A6A6MEZ7_HEVBR|nr:hypothetical protein GH714_026963 [Hevea brasiliensis]